MSAGPALIAIIPGIAALLLALIPVHRIAAWVNVLASAATFAAGLSLAVQPRIPDDLLIIDDLNICFIVINAFVGLTTAIYSATYIRHEVEAGRLTPRTVQFYHAMFQAMTAAMNLALIANNIGLLWVGLELATLITVMIVGMYRTPAALEAAWKYFIIGSVGVSLAFFGTILFYLAGQPVVGEGVPAMTWSRLLAVAPELDAALINLAFVFVFVGYGTKVGLVPMHAWLPDAHAEGPTPISAGLSGLLLNVALFALLRFKMIVTASPTAIQPGPVMIVLGLASLIFASLMLYQRRDIKRLFAYSSIEHMGLIVFALGIGGPLANFAGLLHMAMHSLTKSAIFFAVGHVSQIKGTQRMTEMGGLSVTHPGLAIGLGAGVLAIAGLPPFGVFVSEFLIVTTTFQRAPLLAVVAALGIVLAFGALLLRLQDLLLGAPKGVDQAVCVSMVPLSVHLLLVLISGLYVPTYLVDWLRRAAEMLG